MAIYAGDREELYARTESREEGLTGAEAAERLGVHGPNVIQKREKKNYFRVYLRQYTQFFAVLLEVAAVLSLIADASAPGEGYDILGYAIAGAVVINATFAFWQEYKADQTVEALLRLMPSMVTVRREDVAETVDAREVVPGDVLLLEEGDRIAADAVLTGVNSLYVDLSTLTGESRPRHRTAEPSIAASVLEARNVVFAGTTVTSGNGTAVVYATGRKTEFGKIATLAKEVEKRQTPMQKEIVRITRILTLAAVLVGGVFFVLSYFAGFGLLVAAIFALSLIVANVPEGMLPTITLSLSLASQHMARRNALIKNLDSVQTLGSTTVICTDKTGTLTRNEMTARVIVLSSGEEVSVTGEGYLGDGEAVIKGRTEGSDERLEFFLMAALLNCRAAIEGDHLHGDPTELALVAAARKACVGPMGYEKVAEIPFTSERKMMSTVHAKDGARLIFTKGAPEVVLPKCRAFRDRTGAAVTLDEEERVRIAAHAEDLERQAYRLLAVAYGEGDEEEDLVYLGLIGLMDPPRAEVPGAVATCRRAGIRVMVLTGDNPITAGAVAEAVGLSVDRVITGDELAGISDERLEEILKDEDVLFARMRSDQKLQIATALQKNGEVVAMTGDGVNDAPALKKADIGIAMGLKGTEVAKEAADMVLIDDNFCSIVAAVEEGRTVYFNIKKFVTYILASNVPEIVPYILQFFLRIPLPLTVIQILSIDLGSDMLPGLALGSERHEKDIMEIPPVGKTERILDREVFKRGYFFLGIIEATAAMTAFLGFLFLMGWQYGDLSIAGTELHRQAMTMTLLGAVTCQLANVWTLRSWEFSAFERGLFTNKLLIVAVVLEAIWIYLLLTAPSVQAIFNTASVPPAYLLLLIPFPILLFVSHEFYKYLIRRRTGKGIHRAEEEPLPSELCGENEE
ncbi:cation-transporting P-type ATPase [Methanofollis formosanus]|uniref:Cation-transporting P-type ATPase n=1 Tax=Methanofollis formosanus TaxID=299308 RepID=A0A8G1A346_9EURY|nr:cation-transporting P-type ATPase [Methanofollis formosanus]QYZ80302.1 cation-transporting P-type ATPase [Methanofollis formosanus]